TFGKQATRERSEGAGRLLIRRCGRLYGLPRFTSDRKQEGSHRNAIDTGCDGTAAIICLTIQPMCGRYGRLSRWERIAQLTELGLHNEAGPLQESYNIAPGTCQPIILNTGDGAVLRPLLWGLVPYWSKDPKKGVRPVNA